MSRYCPASWQHLRTRPQLLMTRGLAVNCAVPAANQLLFLRLRTATAQETVRMGASDGRNHEVGQRCSGKLGVALGRSATRRKAGRRLYGRDSPFMTRNTLRQASASEVAPGKPAASPGRLVANPCRHSDWPTIVYPPALSAARFHPATRPRVPPPSPRAARKAATAPTNRPPNRTNSPHPFL